MMLDDFFTLTEINNGLTVPSRVKELVTVMQKDEDSSVKNVSEATRQWSAVATALAATGNQDCLDLFIQLDGLQFISKWLKDVQKFSNESDDSFLEESTIHLLQALGKLHVDYEKLVATEIWKTVEDLLVHKSLKVKHKAQLLFESWKKKRDDDESLSDAEKTGALTDDDVGKSANIGGHLESSQKDYCLSRDTSCNEICHESTREGPVLSALPDKVSDPSVRDESDNAPSGHASSPYLPKPEMEHPLCRSSVESCNPAVSREDILDVQMEFHELESASKLNDIQKIGSPLDKSVSIEEINTSGVRTFPASSNAGDVTKSVMESSSSKLYVAGNKSSSDDGSLCIDSRQNESDGKCSTDDRVSADEYKNSSAFTTEEGGKHHKLCKSSGIEKSLENTKELQALRSGIEDRGKIKKLDLQLNETRREPDRALKKLDVELYGIIDPLEVARQVAIEVEREIVGYREQIYSSSEKLVESNEQHPGSPDSVSGNQSHASDGPPKDAPNDPDSSAEASPMQEESATSTENLDDEQTNGAQDMETSQVTEAAQEENNTEREPCNFDLNEEVFPEDIDRSANQFTGSVSIVSASRAAAPAALPVAPLQFEGNLGWKGSAATSAFRPASPWKLPETERDISTGGSSSNSKQQQRCLDIDLNVAEILDDLSPNKNIVSSMETNARRSEHPDLDLNLASEDDAGPSNRRMGQFFPQLNGHQDRYQPSSSSSRQPSFNNIDLNDQPSFLNDSSDDSYLNKPPQNFSIYGGINSDDSVISIMGTRVEVNRENLVPPFSAFPKARSSELAFDANLSRTGNFLGIGSVHPYTHSSVYGYNTAPGHATPFSSTIYGSGGPYPYMIDSRGAPVVPQMTGFSQTPFFINMTESTSGVGPAVPSQRSSFDLNSGIMGEGGSRDTAGFFLNSGRVISMEEQLRSNIRPAMSSVVSAKRKEPDNGREQYPFKHHTPPWK